MLLFCILFDDEIRCDGLLCKFFILKCDSKMKNKKATQGCDLEWRLELGLGVGLLFRIANFIWHSVLVI